MMPLAARENVCVKLGGASGQTKVYNAWQTWR